MLKKLFLIQIVLFWITISSVCAQKAPLKWGKITDDEINWKPPWNEIDYQAFVLYDYGVINFSDRDDITITRHKRIKYKEKPESGQVELPIPVNKSAGEKITRIKAMIFLKDAAGKYQAIELKTDDFLVENNKVSGNEVMVIFKGLEKESIVECQYSINSRDTKKLINWNFQSEFPTMHSEVRASISDIVKVDIFYRGIILSGKYRNQATNQWVLTNMKEIAAEPFSPFPGDYIEQVTFQLSGFYKKSSTYGLDRQMDFTTNKTTWSILAVDLLKSTQYQDYLENSKTIMDSDPEPVKSDMSEREKVQALYDYVIEKVKWNKSYSVYPDKKASELLQTGNGNGAAANLFLITLLKNAGFEASPVLISTRSHGTIQASYPDLSQFNHVIASVRLYGKDVLMDASDRFTSYNLVPVNNLNVKGYLIGLSDSRWLDMPVEHSKASYTSTNLTFDKEGQGRLSIRAQYNNYAASEMRRKFADSDGSDDFANKCLVSGKTGFDLDSIGFEYLLDLGRPLKATAEYHSAIPYENVIHISPIFIPAMNSNPFTSEKRTLPVDFGVPFENNFSATINIPEGYQVREAPSPYELSLPGKKGMFSYLVIVSGNKIKIKTSMKFTEYFFQVEEYPELKEFFEKYFDKISEQVVLEKTE